jgi:hypothetical protein
MTDHHVLTPQAHADLRVRRERGAEYGDAVMSCVTVPDEFRQVQAHYPILFRRNIERDEVVAVALFGFEEGENLFLAGDRWDADYVPLAMSIQPFLIGGAPGAAVDKQVHVDLASPRIAGAEGVRVFDEHARPTPYLETIAEQLGALDAGWQGAASFYAALRRHELLEPLTFEITLDNGSTHRLVGFYAVNEDRLRGLDAAALGDLHAEGHLMPLFMAVASIGNIATLVTRKNRRMADG